MFISLIFPCHNEELAVSEVISHALQARRQLIQKNKLKGLEILVIDDASTDNSLLELKRYDKDIKIISIKKRQGYGGVLQKAFDLASGDWLAFCDLDASCNPLELEQFIDLAQSQNLDIVWGNRLGSKSEIFTIRRWGNHIYQVVFYLLTLNKVPDPCSGFRLFKHSSFAHVLNQFPKNLSFSLALTSYCIRYKIPFKTLEISYKERKGKSKLNVFKDGWIFLFQLVNFLFFKSFQKKT